MVGKLAPRCPCGCRFKTEPRMRADMLAAQSCMKLMAMGWSERMQAALLALSNYTDFFPMMSSE